MKKLLLIYPDTTTKDILDYIKMLELPPINLAWLASVTPDSYDVEILDERKTPIDFNRVDADVVGITSMTHQAPRAYELANAFRNRGIPVIIGGIHASMLPDEAGRFADCVVVGEAEEIWPGVLKDLDQGKLKPLYRADTPNLDNIPQPRRDLLPKGYWLQTVQSARGCPFDCEFCAVTLYNGKRMRTRPIDHVIEDISQIDGKWFIFADDNIIGAGSRCTRRTKDLFREMAGLGKEWFSQICISVVEDDEMLDLAAAAGARIVFIGFESIQAETVAGMNKSVNLRERTRNYKESIKRLHDHGISIVGSFVMGSDQEDRDSVNRTIDFIHESGLDSFIFMILTPLPGTRLYERLEKEGRLTRTDYPRDWQYHSLVDIVFEPKNFTMEELKRCQTEAYLQTGALRHQIRRAVRTMAMSKSAFATLGNVSWNLGCWRYGRAQHRAQSPVRW